MQTDKVGACVELNIRRSRILESRDPLTRRFKYSFSRVKEKKFYLPRDKTVQEVSPSEKASERLKK